MNYRLFFLIGVVLFIVSACQEQQPQKDKDDVATVADSVQKDVSPPDSIKVSVSVKGKRDRISLLQQKVMLRAKKKLADSLISLRNFYADTTVADVQDYEVFIHDIHVVNEGVRYPQKNDPTVVEAYITIVMKYEKPVLKEQVSEKK